MTIRGLIFSVFIVFSVQVSASQKIDLHDIIVDVANTEKMKASRTSSIVWMDEMLVRDYGFSAISEEPEGYLKELYGDAAWLLKNGYPIAGGTLITIARSRNDFKVSQAGPGMAHFVDAMLQPSDDDDAEFGGFLIRAQRAVSLLSSLPGAKAMAAQLYVVGGIYVDVVAFKAGKKALTELGTTQDEWIVIDSVREQTPMSKGQKWRQEQ